MKDRDIASTIHSKTTELAQLHGRRLVTYVLDETEPFPAPQVSDYTKLNHHAVVIVPNAAKRDPVETMSAGPNFSELVTISMPEGTTEDEPEATTESKVSGTG